jgi:prepilin-type N-terminal cleavage/methylation domain-containing protein
MIPRERTRREGGFTLIELIVALSILVALTAMLIPSLGSGIDKARVQRAAATLEGITKTFPAFKKDNNRYPGAVFQLATPITMSDLDSCGFKHTAVQSWNGPYIDRVIERDAISFPTPIGEARNQLTRDPATTGKGAGESGVLMIVVDKVLLQDAEALNALVDGEAVSGEDRGTVRWTLPAASDGTTTLYYLAPVNGC